MTFRWWQQFGNSFQWFSIIFFNRISDLNTLQGYAVSALTMLVSRQIWHPDCNSFHKFTFGGYRSFDLTSKHFQKLLLWTKSGIIINLKSNMSSRLWLNGLVISALGIRAWWPGFKSRVAPLFHCVATLDKLFTHTASPVSQLQETGVQKGVFGA